MPAPSVTARPPAAEREPPTPSQRPADTVAPATSTRRRRAAPDDALATTLARSVASRRPGTPLLQRKVGFEWEMASIRPWLLKEAPTPMLMDQVEQKTDNDDDSDDAPPPPEADPAWWTTAADETTEDDPDAERLLAYQKELSEYVDDEFIPRKLVVFRPVPRKHVLHQPPNLDWRLEADDTPGISRSNVEYVTVAFDDTPEGLERFHTAMTEIGELVERLAPAAQMLGPGTKAHDVNDAEREELHLRGLGELGGPYRRVLRGDETTDGQFLRQDSHGLSGSVTVPAQLLALSGTMKGGRTGKMQATIGADLAALGQVMTTFGAEGPTLGDEPTSLVSPDDRGHPLFGFVSAAPQIAATIADDQLARLGPSGQVEGFLSALVLAILALGYAAKDELKYRFVLMPRMSHVAMLESLPGAGELRGHGRHVAAVIVEAIAAARPSAGAMLERPLIHGLAAAQGLTIGRWIEAIVDDRVDYLMPSSLDTWLQSIGVQDKERLAAVGRLESFGSLEPGDTRDDTFLAVYEHRGIGSVGTVLPTIEDVRVRGEAILRYMMALRQRTGDERIAWPTVERV